MQTIRKALRLSQEEYYKVHLSIVNTIIPEKMTPKEIEVLSSFMSLEGDIALVRFGPSARKIVRENLGLSPTGLSNYISSLLEKKFLTKQGDSINIWPILIPEKDMQHYQFKLENTDATVNT